MKEDDEEMIFFDHEWVNGLPPKHVEYFDIWAPDSPDPEKELDDEDE